MYIKYPFMNCFLCEIYSTKVIHLRGRYDSLKKITTIYSMFVYINCGKRAITWDSCLYILDFYF